MTLSARNAIGGEITGSITNEAGSDLGFVEAQAARAGIEASDVMFAGDWR